LTYSGQLMILPLTSRPRLLAAFGAIQAGQTMALRYWRRP
jgi:hypothetical protein